jgi:hypothetical protein
MEVNLTKRIDTPEGRRFCPVVLGAGGRVKADWVMVSGREERHPEGTYYIDWTEDGTRRRTSVGTDATVAYNSRNRKQSELEAIAQGLVVTNPVEEETRLRLREAAKDFLEDIELSRQRKTWLGYCLSLKYFKQCCSKTFIEDIERKDLLRFVVFLRDQKELAPRTVYNKFCEILTFLQAQGVYGIAKGTEVTAAQEDAVEGMLNLIDFIQDSILEQGLATRDEIFPSQPSLFEEAA